MGKKESAHRYRQKPEARELQSQRQKRYVAQVKRLYCTYPESYGHAEFYLFIELAAQLEISTSELQRQAIREKLIREGLLDA